LRKRDVGVQRGEPPLLALRREGVVRVEPSVVLVVQLVNLDSGYQTNLEHLIVDLGTGLWVVRDPKRHCKVLEEEVEQLEVVSRRLQQDHDQLDLNSNALLHLLPHSLHLNSHNLALPDQALRFQHKVSRIRIPQLDFVFHSLMLSNGGRLFQHIGRVLPLSGSEDFKKMPMRSIETLYRSN
jgi:hypothetical protein